MEKFYKKTKRKIGKLIQKEHAPIVIVFIIASMLAFGYFGIKYFNKIRQERNEAIALQNEKLAIQQEIEDLEQKLKEESRDQEIEDLRQQLLDLQTKSAETKTVNNTVTIEAKDNVSTIIKEWSPRVAHIECLWFDANDKLYARGSGSATLVNFNGLGLRAITSKHIIFYKSKLPRDCKLELLSGESYSISINDNNVNIGQDADWAYLTLPIENELLKITQKDIKACKNVDVGDKLLVLGYPKIGSKTGLTVTEGIVSANDKDYYITSAKIDKGNSGGASILVKDDCYLGIPAASMVGSIESLGRILKASFVIGG